MSISPRPTQPPHVDGDSMSIASGVPSDQESRMAIDGTATPKEAIGYSPKSDSEPEMEAGSPHLSDEEGRVHMVRPEEMEKVIVSLNPSTSSAANTLPAVAEENDSEGRAADEDEHRIVSIRRMNAFMHCLLYTSPSPRDS